MKKINTSPISGTQELIPSDQALFNDLKENIARVYHRHGFLNIETPIIDRSEILLAKAGGDTEKQIYKVIKTKEDSDSADQALRFDHTVPLARYVVEHENELIFPFKVSQIGRNFRGERAQRGRFREFYQLDVDVLGREELPIAYDAEVVKTAYDALKTFINTELKIRISNRKLLSGLLAFLNISEKSQDIFGIIDHIEKVPMEKTLANFSEIGLEKLEIDKLVSFIQINGTAKQAIQALKALGVENETFNEGIDELKTILGLLESQGLENIAIADMMIIRGLDYYTGAVFETILPKYREIGSICSGGRYDNLASNYTDKKFPGVGISIGLTRLFYILNEKALLEKENRKPIDIVLIPFSENEYQEVFELADNMRRDGKSVDVNLTKRRLGDKIEYASKIANYCAVIGDQELKTGTFELKNLQTGEKTQMTISK